MQRNWFKLICLCTLFLLVAAIADAKNNSRIVASIKISATVNKISQHAEIRWQILHGKNNMLRFELQKSVDGNNFSYVTSVAGGNNNNVKPYLAEDRNLLSENSFYRLRIIYKNGEEGYSIVTQISTVPVPSVTILPAVADERLYLWLTENKHLTNACITDAYGKVIRQNAPVLVENGLAGVDVRQLATGFYNIIIQTSVAEKLHFRFSKK